MNKIVTTVDEIIVWPLERCQGGKLPTIAPLFWYMYISCSGICTFPVLVMYISCSGICTFSVLVMYISYSGICTFPVLVCVHFLFWYVYISHQFMTHLSRNSLNSSRKVVILREHVCQLPVSSATPNCRCTMQLPHRA